jgi:deoxycytidylate deaminase
MHNNDLLYENAANLAKLVSNKMRFRHGCVLVKNGKIISYGYNRYATSHEVKRVEKISGFKLSWNGIACVHAEIDAFAKLNFSQKAIRGSTLIVYGESRAGNVVKSRPCKCCMKAVQFLRVKSIIYSNTQKTRVMEKV